MTTESSAFNDFLSVVEKSKEVGLAIAKDELETVEFEKIMEKNGFNKSKDIAGFFNSKKTFLIADEKSVKDIYDFMAQYSTGQVEIFDKTKMNSRILNPDYANSALVAIAKKNDLKGFRAKGLDLVSVAGATYQR